MEQESDGRAESGGSSNCDVFRLILVLMFITSITARAVAASLSRVEHDSLAFALFLFLNVLLVVPVAYELFLLAG